MISFSVLLNISMNSMRNNWRILTYKNFNWINLQTGELNVPITCVTIQDNEKNGKGGYAMIKEGGINYRHITVEFVSQTGGDIKFTVYLYGDNGPTMQTNVQAHPAAGWVYPQNIPQNVQPNYPYQQPYPYNTRY